MKILALADLHANIWALEEILNKEGDFDLVCCAGDYTDYGIAPHEVIDRMKRLPNQRYVYGNHDKHIIRTYRERLYLDVSDGEYKWVHYNCEKMTQTDIEWLERLPKISFFEADGWKYCVQHQYDSGYGIIENLYAFNEFWKKQMGRMEEGTRRRLIFGHTHRQCVYTLDKNTQWINPGSISYRRPDDPDKTAHYAVIWNGDIELKRIVYDRSVQLDAAERFRLTSRMMRTEIQDFRFFFGDARTSRDEI